MVPQSKNKHAFACLPTVVLATRVLSSRLELFLTPIQIKRPCVFCALALIIYSAQMFVFVQLMV